MGGPGTRASRGPRAGAMGTAGLLFAAPATLARDESLDWRGDEMDECKPHSAAVRVHDRKIAEVTATCSCPSFTSLVSPGKVKPSARPFYFCQSRLSGGDERWTRSLMALTGW